jgi:hypothetical protein
MCLVSSTTAIEVRNSSRVRMPILIMVVMAAVAAASAAFVLKQASPYSLPRRTNSKNDGEGRLNMAFAEYLRKPVQDAIGPYLAQH